MAKTIVGVFDDVNSSQTVVRELVAAGIPQNQIRLTSNSEPTSSNAGQADASWKDRIFGFFEALFEDENDRGHANHYAEAWRRGHYIVVADVETGQTDRVVEIMNRHGVVDINRRTEQWKNSGYAGRYDQTAPAYTAEERKRELASYGEQRAEIPVVQEELAVGKQVVQRGGVRVHSYVTERPVEELARLRQERVNVERRPVDRPADRADTAFQERSFDVTAQGEEAVVQKRARVVEEVIVNKQVEEREQPITETVRRKDVDVEQIPGESTKSATGGQAGGGSQRR